MRIACVLLVPLCVTASTKNVSSTSGTQVITRTIHIDPPKQNDSRYYYVPFEVTSGTHKITISYDYDRASGTNTLDIGLFDPRFTDGDGDLKGFRGWSGGRRSEIFVSARSATPGYLPGTIKAGTWRIIFGLYRVAPAGVDISVTIKLEADENKETQLAITTSSSKISEASSLRPHVGEREAVSSPKNSNIPYWVSGDLHMHTVHSDGDWTIPQLVTAAREAGLDFICITDHNTSSHHAEIETFKGFGSPPLVIRGEEITTYGGHANAWGLPKDGLVDFRVTPGDRKAMSEVIAQAHARGALISINHPFGICGGCVWGYDREAVGFDAIEVWNGSWDAADDLALGFWDRLLQQGRKITAVASSDSHRAENPLGQAASHVSIPGKLSVAAVLRSIRAGRVYLTSKPTTPVITFEGQNDHRTFSIGDIIRLPAPQRITLKMAVVDLTQVATVSLISDGKTIRTLQTGADGKLQGVEVKLNADHDSYFRVEVRDQENKMIALTNPIYVAIGGRH
jgi:hypothetical protein